MASATGSFRFLTKKSVSNMILTLYEGFFQINFRWLFKVIFLLRADYQAQIETQLSNKKFITIMASATGSFCFLTKKVFITWFWLSTRGFFKTISDDFSKWYFFPHLYTIKIMKFSKKTQNTLRTELSRFTRVFLNFGNSLSFRGWNCSIFLFFSLFFSFPKCLK